MSAGQWLDDSRSGAAENGLAFSAKTFPDSEVKEKVTSARLVKVLDLSSNSLAGLEEMVGEGRGGREARERGEMVCQRLRGLHRLDLKQNQLSRLPRPLMRELKKLSILNLSCNNFGELLPECVLSPALTSLDLSTNKVLSLDQTRCVFHGICVTDMQCSGPPQSTQSHQDSAVQQPPGPVPGCHQRLLSPPPQSPQSQEVSGVLRLSPLTQCPPSLPLSPSLSPSIPLSLSLQQQDIGAGGGRP